MTDVPNLYSFATKELAQDATLAYILSWAQPAYRESHRRLHGLGTAMLHALLASKIDETGVPIVTSLDVKTQVDRIDVLARINDENQSGLVLLVEDKVRTHEHSNQIERYIETAEKHYPNRQIVPVYMKTGNASPLYLPSKETCGRFLRYDILEVLDRFYDTGDTVVDNFYAHLQIWENETNSYLEVPVSEWHKNWMRYEGFYIELENRMVSEPRWKCGGWKYVSNPAGGFLCFTFAWNKTARKLYEIAIYLQIESATRLTLRLGEWSGPGVRAPFMYDVLRLLEDRSREAGDVRIRNAGRFRGGGSAAVADITFGDEEDSYLALDNKGIVDMDTTMRRLDRARELVVEIADCLHRSCPD